jgi:hypothetical protein
MGEALQDASPNGMRARGKGSVEQYVVSHKVNNSSVSATLRVDRWLWHEEWEDDLSECKDVSPRRIIELRLVFRPGTNFKQGA